MTTDIATNTKQNTIFKIAYTVIITLILLSPVVIGYILRLHIQVITEFAIGIYGLYSFVYFLFQIVCSELNIKRITKIVKNRPNDWNEYAVGLVVVGYKEDSTLLKRCLQSIKNNKYKNIKRIVFVIDGNEESDNYMAEIYAEVFNNNIIRINDLNNIDYSLFGNINDNICIMQPHNGKREGLYSGFNLLMNDTDIKVIITTDSDTILDENAILELTYQCIDEEVGAVAGQILLWNKSESLLSHIVNYRYWLSFNLERSCESFWKTVLCVAGPMACYKVDCLKIILEEWYNQKFLGERCTFGDDRHLTNRVLLKGKKVVYTPYALGYTDSPSDWIIYLRQQTRWSKSYFREFLFNLQSIHLHPIWMCFELFYNVSYFFLLMYLSLSILYFAPIHQQTIAIIISLVIGLIKSIYCVVKTKEWSFLYFYLYSFIYYLIIIPSKITALITLWDTKWGTRGKGSHWLYSYWCFILWILTLCGGFGYTIYKNQTFDMKNTLYMFSFFGFISFICLVLMTLISEIILRKNNHFSSELEQEILNEKNNRENIIL